MHRESIKSICNSAIRTAYQNARSRNYTNVYDDLAGDGGSTREKELHGNGNKVIEYVVGTDEKGPYLQIGNIVGVSDYTELPESPRKFRLGNEQDGPYWK